LRETEEELLTNQQTPDDEAQHPADLTKVKDSAREKK
jgi:hypothetical protein